MKRFFLLPAICSVLTACQAADAQKVIPPVQSVSLETTTLYQELCASCHGANLEGASAPNLSDDNWEYGGSDEDILRAINVGIEEAGMPSFQDALAPGQDRELLALIRQGRSEEVSVPVTDVPSLMDKVNSETWLGGLNQPWGITFTPDGGAFITEKSGDLIYYSNGQVNRISNVPAVNDNGQGGLLDVALDPNWPAENWLYLAFSHPKTPGAKEAMTKIIRAKVVENALTNVQTVFEAKPEDYVNTRFHFGSRITFDAAGHLYFSIGDRGKKEQSQDITKPNGKIHRVNRDGTIPDDNPFIDNPEAYASIYSYGNRNPQGLVIHPDTDVLWQTEHGPKGGDELNVIKSGVNYGWPEISYGRNYSGTVLTPYTAKPGMAQPTSQWTPSIAVCGLDVYRGNMFPEWQGRLLAGALVYEQVRLISVDGETYQEEAVILSDQGRVRDVTSGPDGAIYVALPDKIIRLTPAE